MNTRLLRKYAWPDSEGLSKLKERMEKKNMSARSFDRILRVARTIADLENSQTMSLQEAVSAPVLSHHISDAIGYRNLYRSDYGITF